MSKEDKKTKETNAKKTPRGPIQFTTIRRFALIAIVVLSTYVPLPLSNTVKLIITTACVLIWVVLESTSMRLSMARSSFRKGKWEDGWKTMRGVVEKPFIPLSSDEKVFVATAFIQNAEDPTPGVKLLETWLSKTKNEYNRMRATNLLSLAYYSRLNKKEEGLKLVEGLYKEGYEDMSVLINYSTFLLEEKRSEEAFDVILKGGKNIYILDNLGVYYLESGMQKEAIKLYREMLDSMRPHFVEFYVHAFQSELYFDQKQNARDLLENAYNMPRILTSPFKKEYIDRLKKDAETSNGFNHINASPYEVAFGKDYMATKALYTAPSKEDIEFFKNESNYDYEEDESTEGEVNHGDKDTAEATTSAEVPASETTTPCISEENKESETK